MMNWARMQFPPGYEPPRGSPAPGGPGFPFHPMYFMHYGMPPNMGQQPNAVKEKVEEGATESSESEEKNKRFAPLKEDRSEAERKAAAQAKLRQLEEKIKQRAKEQSKEVQEDNQQLKVEDLDRNERQSDQHETKERTRYDSRGSRKDEGYADDNQRIIRSRNDSEASDSSRRSGKDVPPRFQRKRSGQQQELASNTSDGMIFLFVLIFFYSDGKQVFKS